MNKFVVRLNELIVESGKTQNTISSEMGISKQKLSKWKTGYNEPNIDEIIMIAGYFNVTCGYLLGAES